MNGRPKLSVCMIVRISSNAPGMPRIDPALGRRNGHRRHGINRRYPSDCQGFRRRVFEFPWCDDFSAARNESLKHARGEWLFWMDSDDTITETNGCRLRDLAYGQHASDVLGYVMQVHCPGPCLNGEFDCTVVDHVKLIRNLPALRFDGRIHEQVLPAIRGLDGNVGWTDIHVVHSGSDQSPAGKQRKQERDLRILHLEHAERPQHPFTLFNLGMTYADMDDHESAVGYLEQSIANADVSESHLRKAFALLVNSLTQLKRCEQASNACAVGRRLFPEDPELLFRDAIIANQRNRFAEAEAAYIQLLGLNSERHFSSIDRGILGYKTRHNLAAVYLDMNRPDLAELQWRQVIGELPHYPVGWRGLVDCLLRLRRCETAATELEQMFASESLRSTALIIRAVRPVTRTPRFRQARHPGCSPRISGGDRAR